MPAVSKKQEKFMQAVANNPKFAKKVGVKQLIGQEFTKEKGMKKVKKMQMGGLTADAAGARAMDPKMAMAMEARRRAAAGGGMKKGGAIKKMKEGGELKDGVKGITSRKAKKDQFNFQRGYRRGLINAKRAFNVKGKIDTTENKLDKLNRGDNKLYQGEVKGKKDMDAALKGQGAYKKGGTVKSNAGRDGVATRGKTKGRMV